ncbi:MAG: hypothetical protein KatS3mg105_4373 [Gemmatales bacterium]|nr:MAG: hypothetical protein KatS3mg105_4373 [Gemmatales bacterium]
MIQRRRAREVVLQLLFQRDFNASLTEQQAEAFVRGRLRQQNLQEFALALYQGVVENLPAIDEELSSVAENWRLSRMSGIDRNVLRIGAYELMFSKETPPARCLE